MSCLPGAQLSKAPHEPERGWGTVLLLPVPTLLPLSLSPWVSLDISWGVWNIVGTVR